MRNGKILNINQRLSCTAFELSVAQIIGLFFAARDLNFPDDQETFNELIRERIFNDADFVRFSDKAKKLSQNEKILVENFFYQVNADFFIPKQSSELSYIESGQFSGEDSYQDFIKLIWLNPELVNYPYSAVKVIIENSAQWKEELSDGE
jgi:hypothetical protein